jgi:hypothetical protein
MALPGHQPRVATHQPIACIPFLPSNSRGFGRDTRGYAPIGPGVPNQGWPSTKGDPWLFGDAAGNRAAHGSSGRSKVATR